MGLVIRLCCRATCLTMNQPTINLWLLNYQPKLVRYDQILQRLAAAQSQRAKTFKSNKRKLEFGISRLLLEHAIRHESPSDLQPIAIRERQGSTPIISSCEADSSEINLTISHSGNWVGVIAWRTQEKVLLGLDIESLRVDWNDAKARYFCNDQQLIHSASLARAERHRYLTRLWTQKEAFFKAHQIPILNTHTKSADFTDNGLMHSASLNADYQLSLFCSLPIHINAHFVALDSDANVISVDSQDVSYSLSWS